MEKSPATERLERAEEALSRANDAFGRACDRVRTRAQALSRIPAARALLGDLEALAGTVDPCREGMDEFVEALKGVAKEGQLGG